MPISRFFDKANQHLLGVFVGQLTAGGRKQQKGQDEQGPDDQPGHGRRQPLHLQLVGHQHREGELENIVIARPQKLDPKKRRKPLLAQQGKLAGVLMAGRSGQGIRIGHV